MADAFIIRGGKPLEGEIRVSGSKNAALPIIAATILARGRCVLTRVPAIRDVENVLDILKSLGARILRSGDKVEIDTAGICDSAPRPDLVRKLRGSVLLSGALVSRFGKVKMPYPGGDAIGARSLDVHLDGLRALGAVVSETPDHFLVIEAPNGLRGAKIVLRESSVTATENILLASVFASGTTTIKLAATEPHVQDLVHFLQKLGARIEGAGTHTITVHGAEFSHNAEIAHELIPDSDEAMSFAVLAASTRSDLTIKGVEPEYIEAGLLQLEEMGVNFDVAGDILHIKKPTALYRATKIQSGLYPKLMSDQVPPFAVLATQANGTSLIHEWMYEGRISNYVNELIKMGANAMLLDPHRAIVIGPTPLRGKEVKALDIRSGITTVIAALVAEGESILHEVFHLERGYERIEERLRSIGADIQRVEV